MISANEIISLFLSPSNIEQNVEYDPLGVNLHESHLSTN